jgi:hypothetical protein
VQLRHNELNAELPDTSIQRNTGRAQKGLPKGLSRDRVTKEIKWMKTLAPEAIKALQKKVQVPAAGVYDRKTAIQVFTRFPEWRSAPVGRYFQLVFAQCGLIPFKKREELKLAGKFEQIMQALGAKGITVAVYAKYDRPSKNDATFERLAKPFAKRNKAVGLTSGNKVALGKAVPAKTVNQVVEVIRNIYITLLNHQTRKLQSPELLSPKQRRQVVSFNPQVRNLAVFTHGERWRLKFPGGTTPSRHLRIRDIAKKNASRRT